MLELVVSTVNSWSRKSVLVTINMAASVSVRANHGIFDTHAIVWSTEGYPMTHVLRDRYEPLWTVWPHFFVEGRWIFNCTEITIDPVQSTSLLASWQQWCHHDPCRHQQGSVPSNPSWILWHFLDLSWPDEPLVAFDHERVEQRRDAPPCWAQWRTRFMKSRSS